MPLFFSSDINVVDTIENATRKKQPQKSISFIWIWKKKKSIFNNKLNNKFP